MAFGGVSTVERLGDLSRRLHGVLDDLLDLDIETATDPEVVAAMPELIRAGRRLGSVEARVLDGVDRRRVYAPDAYLSSKVMVRHVGQLPGFEAHRRWQTVRMLRDLPKVAAAYEAGTIGTGQVEETGPDPCQPPGPAPDGRCRGAAVGGRAVLDVRGVPDFVAGVAGLRRPGRRRRPSEEGA